jgi:tetratricopeptide (TPR) repeat protein
MRTILLAYTVAVAASWLAVRPAAAQNVDTALPPALQKQVDAAPDARTRSEILERELKSKPDDALLHFHLGNAYFDMSQFAQAEQHLLRSTELRKDFIPGLVNLGSVYDEQGKLEEALKVYRQALELNPNEIKTICNVGIIHFQKRQIEQALSMYQRALAVDPNSQLARYNMAILFADAGLYREAKVEWQKVVDIDAKSDLGQRSHDNIGIIDELLNTEIPDLPDDGHGH